MKRLYTTEMEEEKQFWDFRNLSPYREYLSIYDLSGNKIVEYVSTEHNNRYKSFNEFVTSHKLDIENGVSKISIINELTW